MDADRNAFEALWFSENEGDSSYETVYGRSYREIALIFWNHALAHSAAQPAGVEDARDGALLACRAACDRIIDQYEGWGVHCGIDFHALRKGIDAARASKGEAA